MTSVTGVVVVGVCLVIGNSDAGTSREGVDAVLVRGSDVVGKPHGSGFSVVIDFAGSSVSGAGVVPAGQLVE